jgi:hypothetical protein
MAARTGIIGANSAALGKMVACAYEAAPRLEPASTSAAMPALLVVLMTKKSLRVPRCADAPLAGLGDLKAEAVFESLRAGVELWRASRCDKHKEPSSVWAAGRHQRD